VVDINNGGVKVFSRSELERMAQKKTLSTKS
jgi:hypothetical protein